MITKAPLMNSYKMSAVVVAALFTAMLMVGCGRDKPQPTTAAIAWWNAFVEPNRDELASLTCLAQRTDLESAMNLLAMSSNVFPMALGALLGVGNIEADLSVSNLAASVQAQDDASATVLVTGDLRVSVQGVSGVQSFQLQMEMAFEDNQWVVCDDVIDRLIREIAIGITPGETPVLAPQNTPVPNLVTPAATLSIEQAVQATIQADLIAQATATYQANLALTPTATSTPTPLSEQDRQNAIASALARATAVAQVPANARTIAMDIEFANGNPVISPDGDYVAVTDQWVVYLLSLPNASTVAQFSADERVSEVNFSPDGQKLALAYGDDAANIQLWDVATRQFLTELGTSLESIDNIVFSPGGELLAAFPDGVRGGSGLALWDLVSNVPRFMETSPIGAAAFSPDGQTMAVAKENSVALLSTTSGQSLREFSLGEGEPVSVEFSPDGARLAIVTYDGELTLWQAADGAFIATLVAGVPRYVSQTHVPFSFSPDSSLIAAGTDYVELRVWSTLDGSPAGTFERNPAVGPLARVEFGPGNNGIIVATSSYSLSSSPSLSIWQIGTPQSLAVLPLPDADFIDAVLLDPKLETLYYVSKQNVMAPRLMLVWSIADLWR